MKLIKLEVSNHRNFRDNLVLDLTRPSVRKKIPEQGQTWGEYLYSVAAIFGANAAGKTSIIRALSYIMAAITQSSGSWLDGHEIVRDPFRLDAGNAQGESRYAIDFVYEPPQNKKPDSGVRYHYEFTVNPEGIKHELMQFYSSSRPTTLWERKAAKPKPHVVWGKNKTPTEKMGKGFEFEVAPRELILSRGLKMGSPLQTTLANGLLEGLQILDETTKQTDIRLGALMEDLSAGRLTLDDVSDLARAADTGIEDVLLDQEEAEINPEISQLLNRLIALTAGNESPASREKPAEDDAALQQQGKAMRRTLRFRHRSENDPTPVVFNLGDESVGTLAWLSVIIPVVNALKTGNVLIVDELDTSLHPRLADLMVSLFQDEQTNPYGAQLIFTSHDVSLLLPHSQANLDRHQIWIVEKENDGSSELFSLGDFTDIKAKTNIGKQYLEGRYGGTPLLAPSLIARIVASEQEAD